MFFTLGMSLIAEAITSWNISAEALIPKMRRLYVNISMGIKMWLCVASQDAGVAGDNLGSNPIYLNTVAPFRSCISSWRVGIRCRTRDMALLASLISTHSRTIPSCLGFGTRTTGETHGVGPTVGLLMSSLSKDYIQTSRFFPWREGILPCDWCTGFTLSLMYSLISTLFIFPRPVNRLGYLKKMFSPLRRH